MGTKEDLKKYPVYEWVDKGVIVKLNVIPKKWDIWQWQCHHYIKQQQVKRHPELAEKQKLFFLPTQMHADLHNCTRTFETDWGFKRNDLLYGAKL